MRNFARGSVASCLFLCGCGSLPKLPEEYSVSVADVVNNIRCDLKDVSIAAPFLTAGHGWIAAIDLQLQVVNGAGYSAGAGNDTAFVPQTMTLSLAGEHSGTADRKVGFAFTIDISAHDAIDCEQINRGHSRHSRLRGNLGASTWLRNLQNTYDLTTTPPVTASYSLQFTLVRGGEAGVEVKAIPAGDSKIGFGVGVSGSRKDINTLTIAFREADKPKPPLPKAPRRSRPPKTETPPSAVPPPPPPVAPGDKGQILQDLQFEKLQRDFTQ